MDLINKSVLFLIGGAPYENSKALDIHISYMTNLSYGGRIEVNTLPVEGFSNKKLEDERKRKENEVQKPEEQQKKEEQLRNGKMHLENQKFEEERKQPEAEKVFSDQQVRFSVINRII
jgi:hypothetical protein